MLQRIALILIVGLCGAAQGQTIYRIVGPDGKTTFSDKPPLAADPTKVTAANPGNKPGGTGTGLPFELRPVVAKYPVTLYTAPDCTPCSNGRSLLERRGVPFTERTVVTPQDAAALQRITGEASLPVITVGTLRIKGLSDAEWNQTLDAAGYPAKSVLPSGYRNPSPAPLVAMESATANKPDSATPATAEPPPTPALPPPGPTPSNPAGITF